MKTNLKQTIDKILKLIGIFASMLAVFDFFPIFAVSAIGILIALIALLLSGVSAISGDIRYAVFTLIVVTFYLFVVSVLPFMQDVSKFDIVLYIGVPYIITFLLIAVGVYRRRINRSS